jgi:hypothetical protein
MPTVTDKHLQAATRAVDKARVPYDKAIQARRELVRRALKQGMKPADVARQTGLTRAAIGLMRDEKPSR